MEKQILDKKDIERIIARISTQILERNTDPSTLLIIGIKQRGDILARRIAEKIQSIEGSEVGTSAIDITFYRDDVQLKAYKYVGKGEIHFDVTDKNVVLVDDVLFTGRSIRAAIDVLIDSGRPRSIQLAVLIDRGGREFPIQPDYTGKEVYATSDSQVLVKLVEVDGEDKVLIIQNEQ
jgi:pyrimidine operon attenuation protein/uracil phosphoribosyltransferase